MAQPDATNDDGRVGEEDRGPKEFECDNCGAATYEHGPCVECGLKPYEDPDDGLRADSDAQSANELTQQFEKQMGIFVQTTPEAHLEGIMGSLSAYRNWLLQNLEKAGPVSGQKFATWMRSATRDPSHYPEPWGADLIEQFDEIVIDAAETQNIQPKQIIESLDQWVEHSKDEIKQIHELPEGFFDVNK